MRALFSLLFLSVVACAPATVQMARTNGEGVFQMGIEPGVAGAAGGGSVGVVPSFNLAARYGVSDRFDVGGRVGTSVYELQFKYMFSDPAATDRVATSIAPSTMIFVFGGEGGGAMFWNSRAPVLFGVPVGRGELTFGPGANLLMSAAGVDGAGGAVAVLSLTGQVGVAARVSNGFRIMPQIDFGIPVVGAAAASGGGGAAATIQGAFFGIQLGFLLAGPN